MGVGGGTGDLAYQHAQHALAMMYSQSHEWWAMEVSGSSIHQFFK